MTRIEQLRAERDRIYALAADDILAVVSLTGKPRKLANYDFLMAAPRRELTAKLREVQAELKVLEDATLDGKVYFNCCPDFAAPDWSRFDALELGGCIDEGDDDHLGDGTCIVGGIDRHQAHFLTVYGHLKEGGVEDITDITKGFDAAFEIAKRLARLTGLDLHVHC